MHGLYDRPVPIYRRMDCKTVQGEHLKTMDGVCEGLEIYA
jgi:hypothetical protein